MKKVEIGWLAGIYEGEGTIWHNGTANRRGVRASIGLSVCQKDKWVLFRLRKLVGGTITTPPKRKDKCSFWFLYGDEAYKFLKMIWPFLSPRRRVQANEKLKGLRWRKI